jgi:hypothetical protein
MKRYHGRTLLYLHETIELGCSDRFTEVFGDVYNPMMEALGARLFAIWETTPFNGHWPQVTIIWEIDAFADYARIGKAQSRGGSHEEAAAKWSAFLSEIRAKGEGRIMYAQRPALLSSVLRPTLQIVGKVSRCLTWTSHWWSCRTGIRSSATSSGTS